MEKILNKENSRILDEILGDPGIFNGGEGGIRTPGTGLPRTTV